MESQLAMYRADIKYLLPGPVMRLRVEFHVVPTQALVSHSCVDGHRKHRVSMFSQDWAENEKNVYCDKHEDNRLG